jgi:hypothetical protein
MKWPVGQGLLVGASLLAAACTVATSDITANYDVSEKDGALKIYALFFERGGGYVEIGDSVVATFRGRTYPLEHADISYGTSIALDTPVVTDEPITVTVERDGDELVAMVTAPPPLDVATPPLFISRSQPLTLSWGTATDDYMAWSIDSFYVEGKGEIPPGVNTFTIPADAMKADESFVGTRSARLLVDRARAGTVDPGFDVATIGFRQQYAIDFASTR